MFSQGQGTKGGEMREEWTPSQEEATKAIEEARFLIVELHSINVMVNSRELGETGLMKMAEKWLKKWGDHGNDRKH
jgi:hypothetical protein